MEPQDVDVHLLNVNLRELIFFTGLDLSGNTAHHNTIFNAFTDQKRERSVPIHYKILTADNELFRDSIGVRKQQEKTVELSALKSHFSGIIKRGWPKKYLENRPALIVAFVDLDWDNSSWIEKRTECESKINTLRQTIGSREIRLALVLIQQQQKSVDDSIATEKTMEMCQHCRISSRNLYVFPLLADANVTSECVGRLEMAFHEICQDVYQVCFKKIRARNVPNNDPKLLLRQQFKLAFISELREDRHSALRYYKQAYQTSVDLEVPDLDAYETFTVASILNFKVCELNFLLNSPVESLNQFRRHTSLFFVRNSGTYPSSELAAIEMQWWKSQQCRLFADIFSRAISNGLAAYASQNPGRFFEEAATYYKRANALIRQLKQRLTKSNQNIQQRQTPPLSTNNTDPLQTIDLHATTEYFGQRPWRIFSHSMPRASSEPSTRSAITPLLGSDQHLIEHAAKIFLEKNIKENYIYSLQLFSSAVAQFKRYHCERCVTMAYLDMADDYISSRQFVKALQLLRHVCTELRESSFQTFYTDALIKMINATYCVCNLNEWIWALVQLLRSEHQQINEFTKNSLNTLSLAKEIHEESWLVEARKFLAGNIRLPFPIPEFDSTLFPRDEIEKARQQWHQSLDVNTNTKLFLKQFQMNMTQFENSAAFLYCQMHFLFYSQQNGDDCYYNISPLDCTSNSIPSVFAQDPVPIEVILYNYSSIPLIFQSSTLLLEQSSSVAGKTMITLEDWVLENGAKIKNSSKIQLPANGEPTRLLFIFRPCLSEINACSQQTQNNSRSQSPSSANRRIDMNISIRRFSMVSLNGIFYWETETFADLSANKELHSAKNPLEHISGFQTIRVCPKRKQILLKGPSEAEQIQLYTEESIELTFTLVNITIHQTNEDLKNVRVYCQKIYREEEPQQKQNDTFLIQHQFAISPSLKLLSQLTSSAQQYTFVPIFNQEVATILSAEESTDFSIRLQSKSSNCVGIQVQVFSTLASDGEPVEWVQQFRVRLMEPFKTQIGVYCENGERAQCLVYGQKYRIAISIILNKAFRQPVQIANIQWKLNTPTIQVCSQPPLAAFLIAQLEQLTFDNSQCNDKTDEHLQRDIWMQLPETSSDITADDHSQRLLPLGLGDVIVEWSSVNSHESVRSVFNIGQLPFVSSPIAIQAELLDAKNDNLIVKISEFGNEETKTKSDCNDMCFFEVGQPFWLRFTLWNSSGRERALPVHVCFEQTEGLLFAGIKEDHLLFLPDGQRHTFVQTIVPLCPGKLSFPRPTIKCTNNMPGRPVMDLSSDELDRLNRQISTHTINALPNNIFVMP